MLQGLLNLVRPLWRWAKRHPVLSSITVLVLIRLAISALMLSRYLADYGYIVLSADDTTRGALAYTFWHHPFLFPPSHFLPLHSYIAGLVIGMVGDIHDSCVAVSLLFGILTLVMGYLVGRKLAGELGGWIAALLLLLEPYPFWVSFSGGLTDTIFYALILAGLLVILYLWERPRLIWLGSIIFLLATMTRYESVSYIVLFAGVVIWLVMRGKIKWWVALPALIIVTLYQFGVLVRNYVETGNPLSVVENYAAGMYADSRTVLADTAIAHLIYPFKVLWQNNPLLVWFLPLAIIWAFWGKKPSSLAAVYCLLGFAFLFYIVQDKGAGFAPNRYFAQIYVTALPILAAMLVAIHRWLKERWKVSSVIAMLPFVLVFAQLATSWSKVQTLTIGFNQRGVGMPPVTREVGKLLESMWALGALPADKKVAIEMKPHEMYGIPYFSNHPDRCMNFKGKNTNVSDSHILTALDYSLTRNNNSAVLLLSSDLIEEFYKNLKEYEYLTYPVLYGEAPSQIMLILPYDFPFYTRFKAYDPYNKSVGVFYKKGMGLPLNLIEHKYSARAVLHGNLSFVARKDNKDVDLMDRPVSLLIAAPFATLGLKGAVGWVCDGKLITESEGDADFILNGKDEMSLECWLPINADDFPTRVMELNMNIMQTKGNTRLFLICESGKTFPFPENNATSLLLLTTETKLDLAANEMPKTRIFTGLELLPGERTLYFKAYDMLKNTSPGFELNRNDMMHLKLTIQTLEDDSMLTFKVVSWNYHSAEIEQ